ncbi:terminase large subunit [Shewanella sp. phage 1/40]|uniref:terminase large subunit n=1 Tax=Shewanella sp. phage 1/40 TaxID=1458860 RepID=UPI0004F810B4|nr:terminase large subunit [Shewanella sp. phage 1/40]AHK11503.1 terminase large subunit [Shewanella sp. phage 1/40]
MNWLARPEGSNLFQREWLHKAETVPAKSVKVRAWDLAHSEPSDKNRYPDYSASIAMVKADGEFYIVGDFDPEIKDPKTDVVGRFRKRFGDRNTWMLQQAEYDGVDTTVLLPKESGAGKAQYETLVKMFTNEGFHVKGSDVGNQKGGKVKRFSIFSSACQNGLVHIVESSFENKATLEAFYKELEAFDGSPSTAAIKDDWVDTCGDCMAFLLKTRICKAFTLPTIDSPSLLSHHKSRIK